MHLHQIGAYVWPFISQTLTLEPMTLEFIVLGPIRFFTIDFFWEVMVFRALKRFLKNLYFSKGLEDGPTWANGTMVH
jgi:hypothetical protein